MKRKLETEEKQNKKIIKEIKEINEDIISIIMCFLTEYEVIKCSSINSTWRRSCLADYYWENIYKSYTLNQKEDHITYYQAYKKFILSEPNPTFNYDPQMSGFFNGDSLEPPFDQIWIKPLNLISIPVFVQEKMFCIQPNSISCFNMKNGDLIWENKIDISPKEKHIKHVHMEYSLKYRCFICAIHNGSIRRIDENGVSVWSIYLTSKSLPSFIIRDDVIISFKYSENLSGTLSIFALDFSGRMLWETSLDLEMNREVLMVSDLNYIVISNLVAYRTHKFINICILEFESFSKAPISKKFCNLKLLKMFDIKIHKNIIYLTVDNLVSERYLYEIDIKKSNLLSKTRIFKSLFFSIDKALEKVIIDKDFQSISEINMICDFHHLETLENPSIYYTNSIISSRDLNYRFINNFISEKTFIMGYSKNKSENGQFLNSFVYPLKTETRTNDFFKFHKDYLIHISSKMICTYKGKIFDSNK